MFAAVFRGKSLIDTQKGARSRLLTQNTHLHIHQIVIVICISKHGAQKRDFFF